MKSKENARDGRLCPQKGMAFSISEVQNRIELLHRFMQDVLAEGVDYGAIPHTNQRCLFKSGAEKLCDLFGFAKQLEITSRTEDFEKGFFHYEVKTILICKETGLIEAEGIGCCNSKERKYKNQDAFNLVNTILKMAKKRAFVDAVLSATRSSDLFTQDTEEEPESPKEEHERQKKEKSQTREKDEPESEVCATKKQISFIFTLLSQKQISVEQARDIMQSKFKKDEANGLSKDQASDFIAYLKEWQEAS